jgi:hypothetical protein
VYEPRRNRFSPNTAALTQKAFRHPCSHAQPTSVQNADLKAKLIFPQHEPPLLPRIFSFCHVLCGG